MSDQKKAYAYALGTVFMWSTVASAFKLSLRHLDTVQLLLYSSLASIVTLAMILTFQGRLGLVFSMSRRQYLRSVGFGLLNPFVYYLILFKAYDLLPAQEAQPLNYTWAITLSLLSIPLLGQRLTRWDLGGLCVSYAGVVMISSHGDPLAMRFSDPLGVFLALLSTVIWALYWIFSLKDDRDPVAGLLLNFLCGLPFIFLYCLVFSDVVVTSPEGLAGALYVGVVEMGLAFALWLAALRHSENTARVGNLIFLSPFLSLVFIHFLVGESILPSTLVGLALIIAGLLVQQWGRRRLTRTAAPNPGAAG